MIRNLIEFRIIQRTFNQRNSNQFKLEIVEGKIKMNALRCGKDLFKYLHVYFLTPCSSSFAVT